MTKALSLANRHQKIIQNDGQECKWTNPYIQGLPRWSPSQVLATIYCVKCVCVTALSGIYYSRSSWEKVIIQQLSPLTLQFTLNCHTGHSKSLCARDRQFAKQQSTTVWNNCYSFTKWELNIGTPALSCTNEQVRTLREGWRFKLARQVAGNATFGVTETPVSVNPTNSEPDQTVCTAVPPLSLTSDCLFTSYSYYRSHSERPQTAHSNKLTNTLLGATPLLPRHVAQRSRKPINIQ